MANKKDKTSGGKAQAAEAVPPVEQPPVEQPPVEQPPVEQPSLPSIEVKVLREPLPFAEGGHKLVTYPAGHRVADMSDDAQKWLAKNDLDKRGRPGVFTTYAELPDEEGAKLAADIAEAQRAVEEAGAAAQEAANAFVTAETLEEVQTAQEANNNASTVLSAALRRLNNLSDG